MLFEIALVIIIVLISALIYTLCKPLPEWHDLHGDEYLKWKNK
jgi:hypothetical protein